MLPLHHDLSCRSGVCVSTATGAPSRAGSSPVGRGGVEPPSLGYQPSALEPLSYRPASNSSSHTHPFQWTVLESNQVLPGFNRTLSTGLAHGPSAQKVFPPQPGCRDAAGLLAAESRNTNEKGQVSRDTWPWSAFVQFRPGVTIAMETRGAYSPADRRCALRISIHLSNSIVCES